MRDPWNRFGTLEPDETYLVLASSIPARRYAAEAPPADTDEGRATPILDAMHHFFHDHSG